MADIFTVTSPMTIRTPNGDKTIMAAVYPHPDGILYFDLYWDQIEKTKGIEHAAHIIAGELKGDGPWKVGEHVITLLGCQGSEPMLAQVFAQWVTHVEQQGFPDSSRELLKETARKLGATID